MKICGFRGEKEVFEERSAAMNYQILFNPYAKSGHGANEARALDTILAGDQLTYTSGLFCVDRQDRPGVDCRR